MNYSGTRFQPQCKLSAAAVPEDKMKPDDSKKPLIYDKINIFWFSGTGNSLIIAIEIKNHLSKHGYEVTLLPLDRTDPSEIDKQSIIGFVVPVAGQSTYPFIWEFLERLPETAGTPCFFLDTLGFYSGGILGPVKKIVKKKGFIPLAAKEIIMPNIFQKKKCLPPKVDILTEKGKKEARIFCEKLIKGRGHWFDIPVYSWLVSILYRSRNMVNIWKKMFTFVIDPDKCNRCKICIDICPEKSLFMEEKGSVPVRNSKCTLCHRCFAYCPANAIRIGGKNTPVYKALSLKEMMSYLKGLQKISGY